MNKNTIEIFDDAAKIYQDKYMDVGIYNDALYEFCENIKSDNANVLDIACGPGNICKYILTERPGFNVLGIDMSANMIKLARVNNPTAQFKIMDCRDILAIEQKFDGVICGFCLPYLSKIDALKLVKDIAQLLNPNGLFYLSTMEDDYDKSGFQGAQAQDKMFV